MKSRESDPRANNEPAVFVFFSTPVGDTLRFPQAESGLGKPRTSGGYMRMG